MKIRHPLLVGPVAVFAVSLASFAAAATALTGEARQPYRENSNQSDQQRVTNLHSVLPWKRVCRR